MTAISNFTQAVRELTGFDDNGVKGGESEANSVNNEGTPWAINPEQPREVRFSHKTSEFQIPEVNADGGSLITRSMSISGQVDSENQLKVEGKVSGEIKTNSSVSVSGVVIGNVNSNNLSITGKIKGDISSKSVTRIDSNAVIVGDVHADNLYVFGRVKGNLTVQETTEVAEGALVVGDIVTGSLASNRGSIIDGKIIIKDKKPFNFDAENLFKIEE